MATFAAFFWFWILCFSVWCAVEAFRAGAGRSASRWRLALLTGAAGMALIAWVEVSSDGHPFLEMCLGALAMGIALSFVFCAVSLPAWAIGRVARSRRINGPEEFPGA